MSMIVRHILFLSILFSPVIGFSQAKFIRGKCSIEIPIEQWMSKEHLVAGSLNVEFKEDDLSIPTFSIHLDSRRLENPKIDLIWDNIDLIDRNERGIFDSDYQQDLMTNHRQPLSFFSENGKDFMAHSLSLQRIQNFFSLFLSQFSLTLKLKSDSYGYQGDVVVPLGGSDLSVRELANHCFPEQAQDYLEGLTRKIGYQKSWKTSYGIFELQNLALSSPEAYLYRELIEPTQMEQVQESHVNLKNLKSAIENRQEWINEIGKVREDERYNILFTDQSNLFELYFVTKDQVHEVARENGPIQKSRKDLDRYSNLLKSNKQSYLQAKLILESLRSEDFDKSKQLQKLYDQLLTSEKMLKQVEATQISNERQIRSLTNILMSLLELKRSAEIDLQENSSAIIDTAFLSLTQIKQKTQKLFELYEDEKRITTQLASLSVMVDLLREAADKQGPVLDLYKQSLQAKAEMTRIMSEYNQLQAVEVEVLAKRGGISLNQISELMAVDVAIGPRSWNEKEVIAEMTSEVVASYKNFEQSLNEIIEISPTAILPQIICTPESFKATSFELCLETNKIADDRVTRKFFESLGSERLDHLLAATLAVDMPYFDQQLDKIDLLMQEAQLEKIALESSGLLDKWNEVLYARWKYFKSKSMKVVDNDFITWSRFQEQLSEDKAQALNLENEKEQRLVGYTLANQNYLAVHDQYTRLEKLYFANLQRVRQSLFNIIELDQVEGEIVNCLLAEPGSLPCFEQFATSTSELEAQSVENRNQIGSSIQLLTFEATYNLSKLLKIRKKLELNNQEWTLEIQNIELSIEKSGLVFGLEELVHQLKWARKELQQLVNSRLSIVIDVDQAEDRLELGLARKTFLEKTLFSILPKVRAHQNLIRDYCIKESVVLQEIQKIDKNLSLKFNNLSVTASFDRQKARVCSLL